jgi:hypothetical protein
MAGRQAVLPAALRHRGAEGDTEFIGWPTASLAMGDGTYERIGRSTSGVRVAPDQASGTRGRRRRVAYQFSFAEVWKALHT